jgi:hypothetical protein
MDEGDHLDLGACFFDDDQKKREKTHIQCVRYAVLRHKVRSTKPLHMQALWGMKGCGKLQPRCFF